MLYYEILFFVLLWVQDELKGFVATSFCLVMTLTNKLIIPPLSEYLGNFYEAALVVDFIFFCISFFIISTAIGWILMITMFVSIVFNIIPFIITSDTVYNFYIKLYPVVNVLLFEVLVWACVTTTVIYPYLKRKFTEWESRLKQQC